MIQVTPKQVVPFLISCIKAGLTPMLHGDPGIGKSDIINSIAKDFVMYTIDQRLSQCDPTDMNGFPNLSGKKASYVPMDIWPLASDFPLDATGKQPPIIIDGKRYNGFMIFLDEINSASLAVQAASYKLILDKKIGQHDLHKKVVIVAAGNLSTNNAIVNRMSTAMQSRMVHFELIVSHKDWLEWASKNRIDTRVTSYINSRPDNLHNFDPNHNDKTFACPRTWAFTSALIRGMTGTLEDQLPLIAGTISEPIAREFLMHLELCVNIPTFKQIMADPLKIAMETDPAMLYGVAHMVASNLEDSNVDTAIKYINRLPVEFGTITLQTAHRRNPDLIKNKTILQWVADRGAEMLA